MPQDNPQGEQVVVDGGRQLDGQTVVRLETASRIAIGEAYTYLRSRKLTGAITLDSAIQERIEEIEGVDGAPGQMAKLDEMMSRLENAVKELSHAQ